MTEMTEMPEMLYESDSPDLDRFEAWMRTKLGRYHRDIANKKSLEIAFMAGAVWTPRPANLLEAAPTAKAGS